AGVQIRVTSRDPFGARASLGPGLPDLYRLAALADRVDLGRAPVTLKILLENVLRHAGEGIVEAADVEALAAWQPGTTTSAEIPFMPSRVILQDFTGVPAIVDLAAMRDAMAALGGDPAKVNPLVPADLVIDHSVQVDLFGTGIVHQVNLEFLATVVDDRADGRGRVAFPDTLVGTDSHTPMVSALGVLG